MSKATLKPVFPAAEDGSHPGLARHEDGDHVCHLPYSRAREGADLAGRTMVAVNQDGTFEMVHGELRCAGPAQVATEAYRRGWEQTFGARGGVS